MNTSNFNYKRSRNVIENNKKNNNNKNANKKQNKHTNSDGFMPYNLINKKNSNSNLYPPYWKLLTNNSRVVSKLSFNSFTK